MKKRQIVQGSNAILTSLFSLAIVVLLYQLNKEYRMQWDLSREERHSLSLDMMEILAAVDQEEEPIVVTAFTAQEGRKNAQDKNRYVLDLLQQIDRNSKNILWEQIDFDKERLSAERLGVSDYGRIVVQQGSERIDIKERLLFKRVKDSTGTRIDFYGEEELLRAFSTLHHNEIRSVLFSKGRGELSLTDTSKLGLSNFKRALELRSFSVDTIDLLATDSIPDSTELLVIAQPKEALSLIEQERVLDYVARGGSLIYASKSSERSLLFEKFQVDVKQGTALEQKTQFPYWDRPIVTLGNASLTQEIQRLGLSVVFVNPRAFLLQGSRLTGIQQDSIAILSRTGWLERGGDPIDSKPVFTPERDEKGRFSLAAALEIFPNSQLLAEGVDSSRIVILGDMEWLSNGVLTDVTGNLALGNDIVEWVTSTDQIKTAKNHKIGAVELVIAKPQLDSIRFVALFPMPLLVFSLGFLVWWNRRGR